MIATALALTLGVVAPSPAQVQAAPASVAQTEPERLAIGREIIAVVMPAAQREQMMRAMLDSMMQSMTAGMIQGTELQEELAADPQKRAVLSRFVSRQRQLVLDDMNQAMPALVEAYAHSYARNFNLAELRDIRAFVGTRSGAAFVQRTPALLSDPDVMAWMQATSARGAARQPAELQAFKNEIDALERKRKAETSHAS